MENKKHRAVKKRSKQTHEWALGRENLIKNLMNSGRNYYEIARAVQSDIVSAERNRASYKGPRRIYAYNIRCYLNENQEKFNVDGYRVLLAQRRSLRRAVDRQLKGVLEKSASDEFALADQDAGQSQRDCIDAAMRNSSSSGDHDSTKQQHQTSGTPDSPPDKKEIVRGNNPTPNKLTDLSDIIHVPYNNPSGMSDVDNAQAATQNRQTSAAATFSQQRDNPSILRKMLRFPSDHQRLTRFIAAAFFLLAGYDTFFGRHYVPRLAWYGTKHAWSSFFGGNDGSASRGYKPEKDYSVKTRTIDINGFFNELFKARKSLNKNYSVRTRPINLDDLFGTSSRE